MSNNQINLKLLYLIFLFSGCSVLGSDVTELTTRIKLEKNGDVSVQLANNNAESDLLLITNREWITENSTFTIPAGSMIQVAESDGDEFIRDPGCHKWWTISDFSSDLDVNGASESSEKQLYKKDLWEHGSSKEIIFNADFALRKNRSKSGVEATISSRYRVKFIMLVRNANETNFREIILISNWVYL